MRRINFPSCSGGQAVAQAHPRWRETLWKSPLPATASPGVPRKTRMKLVNEVSSYIVVLEEHLISPATSQLWIQTSVIFSVCVCVCALDMHMCAFVSLCVYRST